MIETKGFDQSTKNMYMVVYEVTMQPKEFLTATFRHEYYIDSLKDLDLFFKELEQSAKNSGLNGTVNINKHTASFSYKGNTSKDIRLFTREINQDTLEKVEETLAKEFSTITGKG